MVCFGSLLSGQFNCPLVTPLLSCSKWISISHLLSCFGKQAKYSLFFLRYWMLNKQAIRNNYIQTHSFIYSVSQQIELHSTFLGISLDLIQNLIFLAKAECDCVCVCGSGRELHLLPCLA